MTIYDDEELEQCCGAAVQPASSALLPDDLFLGHPDRERLRGRFEGIIMASRKHGTEASIADCYRLCGMPEPKETRAPTNSPLSKMKLTPPKSAVNTPQKESEPPKEPTKSPLSDCPSDISEWEEEKKVSLSYGEYMGSS